MTDPNLESDPPFREKASFVEARNKSNSVIRSHIAGLVELQPDDPDTDLLINCLRFVPYNYLLNSEEGKLLKRDAFRHIVVGHMVSWSRAIGVGIDSEEIRYMTGTLFKSHVDNRIERLQEQVDSFKDRKFETDEQAMQQLELEETELERLKELNLTLTFNLNKLRTENFLDKEDREEYIKVLESLATMGNNSATTLQRPEHIRLAVARHIKRGDVRQALQFLSSYV